MGSDPRVTNVGGKNTATVSRTAARRAKDGAAAPEAAVETAPDRSEISSRSGAAPRTSSSSRSRSNASPPSSRAAAQPRAAGAPTVLIDDSDLQRATEQLSPIQRLNLAIDTVPDGFKPAMAEMRRQADQLAQAEEKLTGQAVDRNAYLAAHTMKIAQTFADTAGTVDPKTQSNAVDKAFFTALNSDEGMNSLHALYTNASAYLEEAAKSKPLFGEQAKANAIQLINENRAALQQLLSVAPQTTGVPAVQPGMSPNQVREAILKHYDHVPKMSVEEASDRFLGIFQYFRADHTTDPAVSSRTGPDCPVSEQDHLRDIRMDILRYTDQANQMIRATPEAQRMPFPMYFHMACQNDQVIYQPSGVAGPKQPALWMAGTLLQVAGFRQMDLG